jgi:hypothetical protein
MQKPKDPSLLKRDVGTVIYSAGAIAVMASLSKGFSAESIFVALLLLLLTILSVNFVQTLIQNIYIKALWDWSIYVSEWRSELDVGDYAQVPGHKDKYFKVVYREGDRVTLQSGREVLNSVDVGLLSPKI